MENKLQLPIDTIYDVLTAVCENNGNIVADAVRANVVMNIS